jgi:aminodeoxyfutalosine synthase
MLDQIEKKLEKQGRLSAKDALYLFENASLDWLKEKASSIKESKYGKSVFYNRNIHFEPTNKCIYSCKFCAFYRKPNATEKEGAWDYTFQDLREKLSSYAPDSISEVHITGGVHPDRGLDYGVTLMETVRESHPNIHIKAFTAVELAFFARKSKKTLLEVLQELKKAGLASLPGGGAEIFDKEVRRKIAGGKAPAHQWLEVHETAHKIGLNSNATMLYGHVEEYSHRIAHMEELRNLQDKHNGFMSFIPLRYRNENNALSNHQEVSLEEDLRMYAVARLFLDNIPHLKAYWVMLGMDVALETLGWGVDDLDGTIDDSTKIYSMAGSMQNPSISSTNLQDLIQNQGFEAVERNSLYELV